MHSQPPTHTHNKGLWELKCQWLVRLKNFAPGWSWASPNPGEDILAIEPIYIKRYWKAEYRQKLLLMFLFEITGLLNLKSTSWESYIYMCVYIYMYMCVYTYTYIYALWGCHPLFFLQFFLVLKSNFLHALRHAHITLCYTNPVLLSKF